MSSESQDSHSLEPITQRRLLNDFQRGFPLVPQPFAELASKLGLSEHTVIENLRQLADSGIVSRIGAVVKPGSVGASILAAMSVPEERLEDVAKLVSGYEEVNHNYEREHHFNLWFVVTGASEAHVERVLAQIEEQAGAEVLRLPLLESYHIDLGFQLP